MGTLIIGVIALLIGLTCILNGSDEVRARREDREFEREMRREEMRDRMHDFRDK